MPRFVVQAYLDSFKTLTTGDKLGKEGEFYFKCNKNRIPVVGEIHLSKNEVFDPEPNPTLYFAILDDAKKQEVELEFKVMEKDPGKDDTFIKEKKVFALKSGSENLQLLDPKGKCQVNIVVKISETKNW